MPAPRDGRLAVLDALRLAQAGRGAVAGAGPEGIGRQCPHDTGPVGVAGEETETDLARAADVSRLMRARNAALHAQIALAQGDLPLAWRWAERVTEDADGSRFYPLMGLTPARLLLAQGEKRAAAQRLEACREKAVDCGWRFGAIEARALQALAASTTEESLSFLQNALTAAEQEGYVRTFVDKGEPMGELLDKAVHRGLGGEYARKLLSAFRRPPTLARLERQPLIEPLSERELEVVALLAEGLTYHEIAEALVISINTVKTHLKAVYGKLGVHDRREAVGKARELNLLP